MQTRGSLASTNSATHVYLFYYEYDSGFIHMARADYKSFKTNFNISKIFVGGVPISEPTDYAPAPLAATWWANSVRRSCEQACIIVALLIEQPYRSTCSIWTNLESSTT
jgi:hypothetical protein